MNSEQFLREFKQALATEFFDTQANEIAILEWAEKLDELIADEVAKEVELDKEL